MSEKKAEEQTPREAFEPELDERGALRLDRAFTPEEAQAIDQENARAYLEGRKKRFARLRARGDR